MPEKLNVTSKAPFSADIIVRQESHVLYTEDSKGYSKNVQVEGGVLLNTKISADTLESLQAKISGHVALIG